MKRRCAPAAALPLVLLASASLGAQTETPAVFEGVVADSATGRPVAGVLVRLDTGRGMVSDDLGRFRMAGIEPGEHLVALLTPDCRVSWSRVVLDPGEVTLAALTVVVDADTDEEAWRRRSQGVLLTAADIRELQATSLAEILRRVAPRMVGGDDGQAGGVARLRSRGPSSFQPAEPVVVVDGARVQNGARALDLIDPHDVETLEVLPGAAAGWEYGSDGAAGVIRVTTRGTAAPVAEAAPPERCRVTGFPSG